MDTQYSQNAPQGEGADSQNEQISAKENYRLDNSHIAVKQSEDAEQADNAQFE